jgi:hypothetical protein
MSSVTEIWEMTLPERRVWGLLLNRLEDAVKSRDWPGALAMICREAPRFGCIMLETEWGKTMRGLTRDEAGRRCLTDDKPECAVYFLFGVSGVVEYVGKSVNVRSRLKTHSRSPWWNRALYLPTAPAYVEVLEGAFISVLTPAHNGSPGVTHPRCIRCVSLSFGVNQPVQESRGT